MLHPEMTRALADQHIRALHREAAQHRAAASAAAPLALHWAALAMRLHLSRTRTAATTPATRGAASAAPATRNGGATTTATGARAPMGCIA
jgi:hypothetical protein